MQRHVVICRRHESAPESFTLASRSSGEDGLQWHERQGVASQFESLVRLAIADVGEADGGGMPALTITTRDLQNVLEQPPLDDPAELLNVQPGVGLTILMPIRFEEPARSKYERWGTISRSTHGLSGAPLLHAVNGHPHTFIQRQWADRLLTQFNAGETRQGYAGPEFKKFAKKPTWQRHEIWIRPQWSAADLMGPETFPPPREPLPAYDPNSNLTPEQRAGAARAAEVTRQKKHVRGMWESRGYKWNKATQAWSPPK